MRIALALSLLCAAAGCKKTLHWKIVEDQLLAERHLDAICPETPVEAGLVFRCQLSAHGAQVGEVEIRIDDTEGHMSMREVR